ncbi:threonine aldolase family protein [Amorphus orientalis]|uniref:Threonine aldolase n=1 Tax=Amorphus orientalis TaxID=649198 RepID=A0AAE3VLE0_9HYPH|nr:beta-eliminating lyase-related protein [Amorphus orientalis]MDQ0314165.1 threonine aldolase [Amorphus orientalis]
MNFASDNWAGVSPKVAEALSEAAAGQAPAYGGDDWTGRATAAISETFGRDVEAFFVATGTAANALSLAAVSGPGAIGFCHSDAHIAIDEGGAPAFLGRGLTLTHITGPEGKITPDGLRDALSHYPDAAAWQRGRPSVVSLAQTTEAGTVYTPDEVAAIADIARDRSMAVHMDGARFANAVSHLGCAPADITWKAGVDLLSFGLTKNGAWCAEAIVVFDAAKAPHVAAHRKQAGHLFSKSRFVAAQMLAMLEGGHWLELAGKANAAASRLAAGIEASSRARLAWPCQSNEVFAHVETAMLERLQAAGAHLYPWSVRGAPDEEASAAHETRTRMIANFATTDAEIDAFLTALGQNDSSR